MIFFIIKRCFIIRGCYKASWKTCCIVEKLWFYGKKNFSSMEKTMILYRKVWNFYLIWKTLWYYGKNHGTIVNYSFIIKYFINLRANQFVPKPSAWSCVRTCRYITVNEIVRDWNGVDLIRLFLIFVFWEIFSLHYWARCIFKVVNWDI